MGEGKKGNKRPTLPTPGEQWPTFHAPRMTTKVVWSSPGAIWRRLKEARWYERQSPL